MKPNFVAPDPGEGEGRGGYAVFVGRLSPEKGIRTLLAAWLKLDGRIPLKILGDGPEAASVREAVSRLRDVQWLGWRSSSEVLGWIGNASFLVFPSEWYEGCPRILVVCFAKGTRILAAAERAAKELVCAGRTGLHFRPGDADDLAQEAERMFTNSAQNSGLDRGIPVCNATTFD